VLRPLTGTPQHRPWRHPPPLLGAIWGGTPTPPPLVGHGVKRAPAAQEEHHGQDPPQHCLYPLVARERSVRKKAADLGELLTSVVSSSQSHTGKWGSILDRPRWTSRRLWTAQARPRANGRYDSTESCSREILDAADVLACVSSLAERVMRHDHACIAD
jgi:hypothetical protein